MKTERSLGKKPAIEEIYNKKLKTETSNDCNSHSKTKYNLFMKKKILIKSTPLSINQVNKKEKSM